jgi:cell division protein FtsL
MTLYDTDTVTLLRDILEDAWERLTFEQRAQTAHSATRAARRARSDETARGCDL